MTFRSVGMGHSATAVNNIPLTAPAGQLANDLMIMVVVGGAGRAVSTPSGWALAPNGHASDGTGTTSATLDVFYRRATVDGEAMPAVAWSGGLTSISTSYVLAYSDIDATTPFVAGFSSIEGTATAAHVAGPLTNTDATAWGFAAYATRGAATPQSFTADGAMTRRATQDSVTASTGNVVSMVSDTNGAVSAAAHSYTGTATFSNGNGCMYLAYLKPAAVVGGSPTWTEYNGSTEAPLTLEGEWNGSSVQPLTLDTITT